MIYSDLIAAPQLSDNWSTERWMSSEFQSDWIIGK